MAQTEQEHLETLAEIRDLMQRSTRFLSLSGLSSVFSGIFALIGAGVAFWYLDLHFSTHEYYQYATDAQGNMRLPFVIFFFADALTVLVLSLVVGYYFSWRKAQRYNLQMWDSTTYRMLEALFVPLIAGGIFCLALLWQGRFGIIAPCTLIFYGLALINASKYTLREVYYLGLLETFVGLIASFWVGYGLLFWALGFGVLHIVYGWLMYNRYERTK
jgi:general stress protein CsbA